MKCLVMLGLVVLAATQAACSVTRGNFQTNTHFAYPNSNITPLGHIKATSKQGSFLIPPELTKDDIQKLMNDALAQKPGADMIVNYRLDTTYTLFPFYYLREIKIEGTAAKMQLGEQNIGEKADNTIPKPKDTTSKRKSK